MQYKVFCHPARHVLWIASSSSARCGDRKGFAGALHCWVGSPSSSYQVAVEQYIVDTKSISLTITAGEKNYLAITMGVWTDGDTPTRECRIGATVVVDTAQTVVYTVCGIIKLDIWYSLVYWRLSYLLLRVCIRSIVVVVVVYFTPFFAHDWRTRPTSTHTLRGQL